MIQARRRLSTGFLELDRLLGRFVGRLQTVLASNLTGVYLTGSFALGAGDRASDCDFIVATREPMSAGQENQLRSLHGEIPDWPGYWAYNLEGSYAPQCDLASLDALEHAWLFVNRGHREMEWSTHCNVLDVRWTLRHRSPCVFGMPAREFVCEVPPDKLRIEAQKEIDRFLRDLLSWASFDVSWTQRYAVETISRLLYTLDRGKVISKPGALQWAERVLPAEWHELLRQVRDDRFIAWNEPPRDGSVEAALAFIAYGEDRARRTSI